MKDQYNNNIPADLTLLDVLPCGLTDKQLKDLDSIDWYCFEGNQTKDIFVSQTEFEKILDGLIDNIPPEDCAFKPEKLRIVKIERILHRWSEGGFYWA